MDFNSITQLISSVGFPIAMCAAMGWYVKYITDKHHTEMNEVTEAINNNTLALTRLCDKMDK